MSLFQQYLAKRNNFEKTTVAREINGGVLSGVTKSPYSFDVDKCLEKARKGEKLEEACIKVLCLKVKEIFAAEENVT
jgi:serine/threonine-protein phosphatase PPG1